MGEDVTNAMNFNIFLLHFRSSKFLKLILKKKKFERFQKEDLIEVWNVVIAKRLLVNLGTNHLIQIVNTVEKHFAKNVTVLI